MFTGIITHIGEVVDVQKRGDTLFKIKTPFDLSLVPIGAAIAHSGCCLTVIAKHGNIYDVEVSEETLSKTNLGEWNVGTRINLEQSLKMGDELGGHLVFGHVDATTTIKSLEKEGDSWRMKVFFPKGFEKFVASKGSIALNGVSLTVNEVESDCFGINLIPHTWAHTTFSDMKAGSTLNFEVDMLFRYVARLKETL